MSELFFIYCLLIIFFHVIIQLFYIPAISSFRNISSLSVVFLFSLVFFFMFFINIYCILDLNVYFFNYLFFFNNFIVGVKIFLYFLVFLFFISVYFTLPYYKIFDFELVYLFALSVFGMSLFVQSNDLSTFYLSLEFQTFPLYILAASRKNSIFSTEAGLKYFVIGSFSSALLLFGFSLLYGMTGLTNFQDYYQFFTQILDLPFFLNSEAYIYVLIVPLLFILAGLFFKISAAPFHNWAPDVYDGSPFLVMVFFSAISKLPPLVVLSNFYINFVLIANPQNQAALSTLFLQVGLISIVLGSFSAVYQNKFRRFMAYSSISHVGFLLLALGTAISEGFTAYYFYIFYYFITSLAFFALFLGFRYYSDSFQISHRINKFVYFTDFIGLSKSDYFFVTIFSIFLLSMAALPPLLGFFPKFYVFYSLSLSNNYLYLFFSMLVAVVSSFYYLRIVRLFFFESVKGWSLIRPIPYFNSVVVTYAVFINLVFFIFPDLVLFVFRSFTIFLNFLLKWLVTTTTYPFLLLINLTVQEICHPAGNLTLLISLEK